MREEESSPWHEASATGRRSFAPPARGGHQPEAPVQPAIPPRDGAAAKERDAEKGGAKTISRSGRPLLKMRLRHSTQTVWAAGLNRLWQYQCDDGAAGHLRVREPSSSRSFILRRSRSRRADEKSVVCTRMYVYRFLMCRSTVCAFTFKTLQALSLMLCPLPPPS